MSGKLTYRSIKHDFARVYDTQDLAREQDYINPNGNRKNPISMSSIFNHSLTRL